MKNYFVPIIFILIFFASKAQPYEHQYGFEYNKAEHKIYYEKILHFENNSVSELKQKVKKFLALNSYPIRYEDNNEIIATGKDKVIYKSKFLIFFNNKDYYALYDIKFFFKENKLRYINTNYFLVPTSIKLNSMSWFGNQTNYGSMGWSTTKIPTDVPKKPIEIHYHKRKLKPKFKIFPTLEAKMKDFERKLIKTINEKEDKW